MAYIQGYFSIEKKEEIGSFLYKSLGSYERVQMIKDTEKDLEFIQIRVFIKETLKNPDRHGVYKYSNKEKYSGFVKNGKREGQGSYKYLDSSCYKWK